MNPEQLEKLRIRSEAKRRPRGTLWLIFFVVIALTGVGVYFAWPRQGVERRVIGGSKAQAGTAEANGTARTTNSSAAQASGDSVLTVSGYIVNRERIELSPRFLGQVKWIGVRKGDAVTNGQVLVLLDDAEYRARLHDAEARLTNAQVAVAKAQLDYDRIRQLIAANVETKQNEDDFRLKLESARATQQEVAAQVELMRTYLEWTVIRSPVNGVVLEKLVDAGELVMPQSFGGPRGPSTAVVAIADPKDLQVECDLNEADLAKVYLKQECRVSPEAYPDHSYAGYLAEIAPEANRQKGTLQVKVQIRDPDKFLTPELSAKVDFLTKR